MPKRFDEAMIEAGEDQVIEGCRALRLDHDDQAYVMAKHRRSPDLLDLVVLLGGGLGDYIRMRLKARPPSPSPFLRRR